MPSGDNTRDYFTIGERIRFRNSPVVWVVVLKSTFRPHLTRLITLSDGTRNISYELKDLRKRKLIHLDEGK
jgi:hypothetical protein